jgi:hypothetical protein
LSLASNSDGGSISDTENADLNDVGANNSDPLPNASGISITNSSVVEAPPIPQRYQQSWIGLKMDEMIRTNRR